MSKTCNDCKLVKLYDCFHNDKNTSDGKARICKDCVRHRHMVREYGITLNDYNQMLIDQDYRCAWCKNPASMFVKGLAVDHCHKTGVVRRLLCGNCNTAEGLLLAVFPDAVDLIESFIKNREAGN